MISSIRDMPDTIHDDSQHQALSPVQTRVVVALAQGCSVSDAAETAGVHRMTVHRWLKDPAFDAAVKQTRDDYIEAVCDRFRTLTGLAITKLRVLLESPDTPPAIVAKVSLALLNRRYFPRDGWELPAMDDLDDSEDSEDEEGDNASLEQPVTSDALCNNSSHEPD